MPITDPEAALEGVPHSTWERLAELASKHRAEEGRPPVTGPQVRTDYIRTVQEFHDDPQQAMAVGHQAPTLQAGNCDSLGPFTITAVGPVSLSVEGEFCPGKNWSATVTVSQKVAGETIWRAEYALSPEHASATFNPAIGVAKANGTIGIFGEKFCLRLYGNACYWWFGWRCKDLDETLACFR
ncbi:hypothetical protein [Streptomyces lavendofoliae]|uniref:hypothetical protein n=1 Tax=Streptomyces lavendofoliae TaxID=67314 RepID=UPI003D8DEE05